MGRLSYDGVEKLEIDGCALAHLQLQPPLGLGQLDEDARRPEHRRIRRRAYQPRVAVDGGTHLSIDIDITARLPFPKIMGPAVRTAMTVVMTQMGNGFARNLDKHLR